MKKNSKQSFFKWKKLILLGSIAALLLLFLLTGLYNYKIPHLLPVGCGPAGPNVPREAFQKVWTRQNIMLTGIGDSITRGYGAKAGLNYFDLLKENNKSKYPKMEGIDLKNVLPNIKAVNISVDYSTTRYHIDTQLPQLETQAEDVFGIVVITSGGNDLIHNYGRIAPKDGALYGCSFQQGLIWTENIKQRIEIILKETMKKFPGGCEIFLSNIYDPTDGLSDPQKVFMARWSDGTKVLELTNNKIEQLCNSYENVHLVDIHSEFLGHGIHCREPWRKNYRKDDPHFWYDVILEDPNPRGYDAIRRLFLLKMIKVLPDRLKS